MVPIFDINISSQNLVLKTLDHDSIPVILEYYQRNREFFCPTTPGLDDEFFTVDFQVKHAWKEFDRLAEGTGVHLYIFEKDDPECKSIVGDISINNIYRSYLSSCVIGYKTDFENSGQGIMSEALPRALDYVFDELELNRAEVYIMPSNKASLALVRKVGFVEEGIARKYLYINGRWEDHTRFSILKEDRDNLRQKTG